METIIQMAASEKASCCVHFQHFGEDLPIVVLSHAKKNRILEFIPKWINTRKEPESVVAATADRQDSIVGAHAKCYERFTNSLKLVQAEASLRKRPVSENECSMFSFMELCMYIQLPHQWYL